MYGSHYNTERCRGFHKIENSSVALSQDEPPGHGRKVDEKSSFG